MAISYAQNSFDIRVGGGIGTNIDYLDWDDWYRNHTGSQLNILLQQNISFKKGTNWYLTPSLNSSLSDHNLDMNLNIMPGYRLKMGNKKNYFFPKLGPFAGVSEYKEGKPDFIAGVSTDLAFEFKHFVCGIDGYYSFLKRPSSWNHFGAHITLGVKLGRLGSKSTKIRSPKYTKVREEESIYDIIEKADSYFEQGRYGKAASYYNKAAKKQPKGLGGTEIFNEGISHYNNGKYLKAIRCFNDCSACSDLSTNARKQLSGLISDAERLQQEKAERQAAIWGAIAMGLAQASQNVAQSVNNNNSYRTSAAPPTQRTTFATRSSTSSSHMQDDEDEGISDVKIKCHECGGSGKCKPSGTVEARTTRCGGSGKCPMCNGRGKSFTKCAKCKGKGCSKCDDSGYLDCSACDGSGECQNCDGKGKCPRCHGTGKE